MAPAAPIPPAPVRALVLLSGGLDSRLAACVLRDQGIGVQGLTFESPFFGAEAARRAAAQLGVPLVVEDFTADIVALVESPPHGFGGGMNPCIDCHAAMIRRAGRRMEAEGFHLIATGEVLDERPMSQNRRSLDIVGRESGYGDWLLRPLSARLLPETEPERRGWVDRTRLLDLSGRSRKRQMELADHYGLRDFPTPAGGCRLTEPNYAGRLRDLRRHEGLSDLRVVRLLRVGRHFRLGPAAKLIVGRNAADNAALEAAAGEGDSLLRVEGAPGPTALVPRSLDDSALRLAAAVCARYSDAPRDRPAAVRVRFPGGERVLEVVPADTADVERLRVP
jgi:hypothetical protein